MKSAHHFIGRILAVATIVALTLVFTVPTIHTRVGRMAQAMYTRVGVEGSFFSTSVPGNITVFLVGDAGDITQTVLSALKVAVMGASSPKALIYLGDNVYPSGIPADTNTLGWQNAHRNLLKQIEPFRSFTNAIYFIPGNHDWDSHSEDGWSAAKRETNLIDEALGTGHSLPPNGCPGPVRVDIVPGLQLIALDSSWWLHEYKKPSGPNDGCETFSPEGVLAALDAILTTTPQGVDSIVALHHQLVEPKSDVAHLTCPTSPTCPSYATMRNQLSGILSKHRPLLCASGHNHLLQVMKEQGGCRHYVVSGSASTTYEAPQEVAASFSESAPGFMILHRGTKGPWILDVIETSRDDSLLPPRSRRVFHSAIN